MIENETLTNREKMVLSELVAGKTNPEIASSLCLSIHTVKVYIENIYRKLQVHNKVQAAVFAIMNDIVEHEVL